MNDDYCYDSELLTLISELYIEHIFSILISLNMGLFFAAILISSSNNSPTGVSMSQPLSDSWIGRSEDELFELLSILGY